jgi:hypothetical protein
MSYGLAVMTLPGLVQSKSFVGRPILSSGDKMMGTDIMAPFRLM